MNERFIAELREQLIVAAEQVVDSGAVRPRRRWPRRLALGAVAAAVVLVVAGLMTVRDSTPVAAGVDVIRQGDDILVRLTDLKTRPAEIVDAARKAGLDVRVIEVPVGPSKVGNFILNAATDPPRDMELENPSNGSFTGFRLPVDWDGTLTLLLGREAAAGEMYTVSSEATAPGEVLACQDLRGTPASAVVDELLSRGIKVRTFVVPTPGEVASLGSFGSMPVARIDATSANDVNVIVFEDGQQPDADGTAGGC